MNLSQGIQVVYLVIVPCKHMIGSLPGSDTATARDMIEMQMPNAFTKFPCLLNTQIRKPGFALTLHSSFFIPVGLTVSN